MTDSPQAPHTHTHTGTWWNLKIVFSSLILLTVDLVSTDLTLTSRRTDEARMKEGKSKKERKERYLSRPGFWKTQQIIIIIKKTRHTNIKIKQLNKWNKMCFHQSVVLNLVTKTDLFRTALIKKNLFMECLFQGFERLWLVIQQVWKSAIIK